MIAAIYKRLLQIGKVSGAIAFLAATPYALFQYIQAKESARVEQTLNLFKMYNSAPFISYREHVTAALVKYKDRIDEAAKSADAFRILQFEIVKKENVEGDILLLFDFFDAVTVCVVSKLCSDETAIELFQPRAQDLYVNFYQYMIAQRGSSAKRQFGAGLEAVARSRLPK